MLETMKAWLKKRNILIFLAQIGIYFMLTATWCVVVYITERDPWVATASVRTNAVMFFLLLVVFMANFYVLVPYLYEDKSKLRRWLFWLVELLGIFTELRLVLPTQQYRPWCGGTFVLLSVRYYLAGS